MQPNPRKTSSIRRLGFIDIGPLRSAVQAISEDIWNVENANKPNRFDALDSTRHIVFRFVSHFDDWRISYDRPLWKDWKYLFEPVLNAAVVEYGYQSGVFPRVMLARMAAGGVIQPHRDANPAAKWPHKIHVALLTNDKVKFRIEGIEYQIAEGEVAELNNMGVHAVENLGSSERIHLIFEYYDANQPDPDWLTSVR